jgi:hypothetical protein
LYTTHEAAAAAAKAAAAAELYTTQQHLNDLACDIFELLLQPPKESFRSREAATRT